MCVCVCVRRILERTDLDLIYSFFYLCHTQLYGSILFCDLLYFEVSSSKHHACVCVETTDFDLIHSFFCIA